jgi:hypothetical protein
MRPVLFPNVCRQTLGGRYYVDVVDGMVILDCRDNADRDDWAEPDTDFVPLVLNYTQARALIAELTAALAKAVQP